MTPANSTEAVVSVHKRTTACSPVVIQGRFLVTILLSLTLLSGCAFFEEPVYNRYGQAIETEESPQITADEAPVIEEEKSVATEAAQEPIQEEVPPETTPLAMEAESAAEPAVESTTTESADTSNMQPDTGDYSIQLFGAYSNEFAQGYIQQHQLASDASIHKLMNQGREWFVVLYGNYHTYIEATQARKGLTPPLITHGPWIRSLSHGQPAVLPTYSLQLMASRSREAAEKLIRRHNIQSKGYIYESIRADSPWYLVLYGEYQYARDARKAIPDLPQALQKMGPWVRPVKEK